MTATGTPGVERDGRADFDFLIGEWSGRQRRLRERLKGVTEWEEFESVVVVRKILGGAGNFDEVTMERASGRVYGATLRLYDPATRLWNIYWASDAQIATGPLTPMIGSFAEGRGLFYAHELFEGQAVFARFIWTPINERSCRWEQAFSIDGGATWETNWIMDFTRHA